MLFIVYEKCQDFNQAIISVSGIPTGYKSYWRNDNSH